MTCSLALCTCSLDAQVGQEGIGKADQMQVCNCRPVGAILVMTQPQQLLDVFQPLLNGPALFVRPDDVRGESCGASVTSPRILLACLSARRLRAGGQLADLQPASIHKAIAERPIRLREVAGVRTAPPKQIAPIATSVELPALLEQAPIALQGGGKMKLLLAAGLHNRGTQIIGIEQHHDLDTRRRCALPMSCAANSVVLWKGTPTVGHCAFLT